MDYPVTYKYKMFQLIRLPSTAGKWDIYNVGKDKGIEYLRMNKFRLNSSEMDNLDGLLTEQSTVELVYSYKLGHIYRFV